MSQRRLEAAIDRLMTCARAFSCRHEEACFTVAKWAREQLNARQSRLPEQSVEDHEPEQGPPAGR